MKTDFYTLIRFNNTKEFAIIVYWDKSEKNFCASVFFDINVICTITKIDNRYLVKQGNFLLAYGPCFKSALNFTVDFYNLNR